MMVFHFYKNTFLIFTSFGRYRKGALLAHRPTPIGAFWREFKKITTGPVGSRLARRIFLNNFFALD